MTFDYSDAPPPRDDLIPHGTIATVQMRIRRGNAGEDGMLTRSQKGDSEYLDCEFVVLEGDHAKRKFWEKFVLAGTTDGHATAADISRGTLKAVLDSAFNLQPDDKSSEARTRRTVSLKVFDGLNFVAKIGVEKGKLKNKNDSSGKKWDDKNVLAAAITPGRKEWSGPVTQTPPFDAGPAPAPASAAPATVTPIKKPGWAQ